jgi:predicted site-specific integrase-resolvase
MATKTVKAPTERDRAYDATEVVELTSLSMSQVRAMFADGRIRTIKIGGRRVVPAAEMRRMLASPNDPTEDVERLYNVADVVALTQVSPSSIRRMFRDGTIRTVTIGSRRFVDADEMRRILSEGC